MLFLECVLLMATTLANVITANHKTFNEIVMKSNHVVMVEFFAPWCGHCKQLAPEYASAATKLGGLAKLVAVDCDDQSNRELCGRFQVQGFPTIKIFSAGAKGMPQDYNGERKAAAIVDTLKRMVPARYIQKVGQDGRKAVSLDDFINKNKDQPRVLLVTAMPTTPVLIKALSLEFLNRIQFGEAKFSNQDIVTKLNVQKAPSIFVFEASKTEPIKYDGEIKQESLLKFLSSFAGDEVKPSASSKKSGKMSNLFKNFDDKIHQVKVDSDVKKYCFTDKCVLAGIDTKDAVNLEMTLGFLENLKRIYFGKGVRVTFAWFDSNAVGEKLVNDFKISGQSPSLLLLSQSKYLSLSSPITKTKSIKLVDDFLAGKGQTYNFKVQLNEERSEL